MNTPVVLDEHSLLQERRKELDCVYTICRVAASDLDEREALSRIAVALARAVFVPSNILCRIETTSVTILADAKGTLEGAQADPARLEHALQKITAQREELAIQLAYHSPIRGGFLPEEKDLVESTADICTGIIAKARWIRELKDAGERLNSKNAALRELVDLIEQERRETARLTEDSLTRAALPLVEKLRDPQLGADSRQVVADSLLAELSRMARPFVLENKANSPTASLSPREREIIRLLRTGNSSKDIAISLGLSSATVERHRHNIRRKLGLVGSDANLAGILQSGIEV